MKVQEILNEERNPHMTYSAWQKLFNFKKKWYQRTGTDKAKRDLQKLIDEYPEYYKRATTKSSGDDLGPSGYRNVNPNARDF